MAISQRELFEIAQTHLEEPSNLHHFKAGFAKGEHQLIMVFESGEKVVNTGWGCQEENVKKLNALMGLTDTSKESRDPDKCPACDCSAIVGSFVNIQGDTASQDYHCEECDHEWTNTFKLQQ